MVETMHAAPRAGLAAAIASGASAACAHLVRNSCTRLIHDSAADVPAAPAGICHHALPDCTSLLRTYEIDVTNGLRGMIDVASVKMKRVLVGILSRDVKPVCAKT